MASNKGIFVGMGFFLIIILISSLGICYYENIDFSDAIYAIFLLLTTVNLIIEPTTTIGKIIIVCTIYLGMGTVIYTATTLASIVIEGRTNLFFRGIKGGIIKMKKEKNHIILCGYGMTGRYTLETLKKETKRYLIIEKNQDIVQNLIDKGESVIQGDAMDSHILEKANIKHAKVLISCLSENSDNLYVVMTASELNPDLIIAAKANNESSVSRLHKVGAQIVVMPQVVGGKQLASAILELDKTKGLSAISNKSIHKEK